MCTGAVHSWLGMLLLCNAWILVSDNAGSSSEPEILHAHRERERARFLWIGCVSLSDRCSIPTESTEGSVYVCAQVLNSGHARGPVLQSCQLVRQSLEVRKRSCNFLGEERPTSCALQQSLRAS